ncbi:hypothetical protein [Escherichia coli]|nr:hypothetical protein [Escherichia coli]
MPLTQQPRRVDQYNIANAGTVGYKSMTTSFQPCMPEVRRYGRQL